MYRQKDKFTNALVLMEISEGLLICQDDGLVSGSLSEHTQNASTDVYTLHTRTVSKHTHTHTHTCKHTKRNTDTFIVPGEDPSTLGLPSGQREVKMRLGEHVTKR